MSKGLQFFAALLLAGAASFTPAHAEQAKGDPIKIGAVIPVTGGGAALGRSELQGVLLAEKHINANGGINGRPIQIIHEDDGTNPDTAITKVNKLIYTDKVVAVLGAGQTGSSVAMGAITDPLKMVQIAFSGLGPAVEKQRLCVLHIAPPQDLNARAMLSYAKDNGMKKMAALYDAGYGRVVFAELRKFNAEYGIEIVASETFEIGATDATTQAAKLRAANPDGFFVIGVTGTPVRSLRALQLKQPIISAIGQATYQIVEAMGRNTTDVIFPEYLVAEDPLPRQAEFVKIFQKEFGNMPKSIEAFGWDAVHVLAKGLAKTGPEPAQGKLCEAVRGKFEGANADFDFAAEDMTGLKLRDFVFSRVVDGKFTRLKYRIGGD